MLQFLSDVLKFELLAFSISIPVQSPLSTMFIPYKMRQVCLLLVYLQILTVLSTAERVLVKRHAFARGCYSGRFQVHSHPIEPNYPAAKHIIFDPPFKKTPAITLGMDLLDAEHNHNLRTYVTSSQLSRHGFLLKLHRFGPRNTQWGIGVRWMACPAA